MKKNIYIKPIITIERVNTNNLIAQSATVASSDDAATKERRGAWGDVWNE